ncbi:TonB-dependent siderophore receptor [Leptothoe sp. LEGE 181152]|nr:TonB-dependent siderophore receptor [Leptothoe sp. LEGE 181152]
MGTTGKNWGSWSIQLTVGLWLWIGQGAMANPHSTLTQETSVNRNLLATTDRFRQVAQTSQGEITAIQISETTTGFTLQLNTNGELETPETATTDNAVVVTIPNAVLRLADSDEFLASDPVAGIAQINVTSLPDNQVQIAITGADAAPALEISTITTGLLVSVTPGILTVQASDQAPEDNSLRLVVTGAGEDRYFTPDASTATRTDTPLRDIPNSIQVIPRQVIEDQQAIGIEEVLENAAGVSSLSDVGGRGLQFAIRGFDGAPILRDGFLILGPLAPDATGPEVANLEQVEILRGPASILYGQVEPGGIINLVTKQPLSKPYYNLQLQGGTREFISPSVDLSGPLTEDGRLLYRLNALYRREESFRDLDNDFERFFIAPTLTWLISDSTDLTVNLEYIEDDEPYDSGAVAFGDGIADVPTSRVFSDPDSAIEKDFFSAAYTLEHRFSGSWKLRNQFRYTSSSFDQSITPFPISLDETTGLVNRFVSSQNIDTDTYSLYTNVQGEFNTGSVEHTLLFGVDLSRSDGHSDAVADFSAGDAIDIFEDTIDILSPLEENLTITQDRDVTIDRLGIYLQDQIDILDNLILVAGLRYDTLSQELIQKVRDTEISSNESAVTPRIGIVYQPTKPISLYANYSRSFAPNVFTTDVDGNPLKPEEGEGFEVGIRGEIIENRLAATLAYFDITKQNVSTRDPADLVPPFSSIATGEQRSQGIDFNLTGEVLPGWNMVASYAYIDAEVTEDNTDLVGNRLFGIPEHSASLWTTYEIQSGDLQGLGFGLGFNFVGKRQGDLANSFELDSYFRTDAAVFYRQDNWQVRLNVDNLFDTDYIESTGGSRTFDINWGEPLTVRASVEYEF